MDEQYTPSEDEVRNLYINHCDPATVRDDDFNAEFDRFLARVRSDAWSEGAHTMTTGAENDWIEEQNPYRETP